MTAPMIPWRARWLVLRAALLTLVTGRHYYVSTACLHGRGGDCRVVCKWCPASCVCGR